MTTDRSGERQNQPHLQDMVTVVRVPGLAMSGADGQIDPRGADGFYLGDRRLLSRLTVTVDGLRPEPVLGQSTGAATARFVGVARHLGDPGPDPTVFVERTRTVLPDGATEIITVTSHAREPVSCALVLWLGSDLADLAEIKAGRPSTELAGEWQPGWVRWAGPDGTTTVASLTPAGDAMLADGGLKWALALEPQQSWSLTLGLDAVGDPTPRVIARPTRPMWAAPSITASDYRLPALVEQSLADLGGLLAADPQHDNDHFLTAGAPWYLTLFGRDSIWAARMALPLGTQLAGGTLRTLARRQGRRVDPDTAEAPGKIPHEIRRAGTDHGACTHAGHPLRLPPLYYGTVDATPLWISLLYDAWRWGLPAAEVAELLPHLDGALGWLREHALDATGFVSYLDESRRGLANQGWKNSADAIQFASGRLAEPPIALCEVQGYAYAAARQGADLLDAFGRPGGEFWRDWAARLRANFRDRFWVHCVGGVDGPYPAIAIDQSGRPVDTVTSNIGHLLGTGLLDPDESDHVVRRLAARDMDCGFGLRTMSARAAGFNPLSYHCGSVWTHDTAIAIHGLASVGTAEASAAATSLIEGLLATAPAFGFRLPELHGGETAQPGRLPVPYPAACRPQAWSAAAAVVLVSVILGVSADVPAGLLRLRPLRPSPVGELTVRGLRVAGQPFDVQLTRDGDLDVLATPERLRVEVV